MLSDSLVLHLVLAFVVGGLWVTLVTVVAERSGSVVGGLVGGLPSTAVFSFFFIGLNESPQIAAQATTVYPLVFSFTCFFLLVYAFLAYRGFLLGLAISLAAWFALSALTVISGMQDFGLSLALCALIAATIYYLFAKKLRFEDYAGMKVRHTGIQLLGRAILSGAIVGLAVLLSQVGGPVLGGIFSAFPAVFTSTLYLTNKSGGAGFSRAITRPLMTTSILTTIPYAVGVRYLYPSLGIGIGTVLSYALALPGAYVSYRLSPLGQRRGLEAKGGLT
jgi:uncharacterized membrane protein (GlpM family)